MATIINTPSTPGSSIMDSIVGLVAVAAFVVLFIVYGLPAIRNMTQSQQQPPTTIEVQVPTTTPIPVVDPAPAPTPADPATP